MVLQVARYNETIHELRRDILVGSEMQLNKSTYGSAKNYFTTNMEIPDACGWESSLDNPLQCLHQNPHLPLQCIDTLECFTTQMLYY